MAMRILWVEERRAWWLIDRQPGKPRAVQSYAVRKFGGDKDAARAAAEEAKTAIEQEREGRGALATATAHWSDGGPIGAGAAFAAYLDGCAGFSRKHRRTSAQLVRDYLAPYFEGERQMDLRRLRIDDVAAFGAWMAQHRQRGAGALSESSIKNALSRLRRVLYWLEEDPALDFRMRLRRIVARGLEAARSHGAWTGTQDAWTRAEGARLLEMAQRSALGPIVLAALHTGARKGELLGLDWEDVDLDSGNFRVTQTLTPENLLKPSGKTERSRRHVKMSAELVQLMRQLARERFAAAALKGEQPGRVFRHRGGEPWTYDGLDQSWDRLRIRAHGQYGVRPFAFHSMRHTYASWALAGGQRPTAVAKQLGHSLATLHKHYAHLLRDDEINPEFLSDSQSAAPRPLAPARDASS